MTYTSKIKKGIGILPVTFVLQFMILTFNVTFLVHIMSVDASEISKIGFWEFFKTFWELLIIALLSIAATLRKFVDFLHRHQIDKENRMDGKSSKITIIIMMALISSFVADLHYIPAIVAAGSMWNGENLLSLIFSVVVFAIIIFIILEIFARSEKTSSENRKTVMLFGIILFFILGGLAWLSLFLDETKDLIIAMSIGALVANTFGTILVMWEKKLEGENHEEMFSFSLPIFLYRLDYKSINVDVPIKIKFGGNNIEAKTDDKGCFYSPSPDVEKAQLLGTLQYAAKTVTIKVLDDKDKTINGAEIEIPIFRWKITMPEGECKIPLPRIVQTIISKQNKLSID
ncbi:MAG: hypothetical protein CVT88_00985 [Candidatus Altiarchaeales archaeon HGW-Altiarchaeales-1]|nr:MAG: hypothetical protein CVT88_00985 [Candidatus Altiarchaeales archaeon HGW-Altiarchaeales-1]